MARGKMTSSSLSRENFLERRVTILEERITLIERFVERRFCDSVEEFSKEVGDGVKQARQKKDEANPRKVSLNTARRGRNPGGRGKGGVGRVGPASVTRKWAVSEEEEAVPESPPKVKEEVIDNDSPPKRYNTRKRKPGAGTMKDRSDVGEGDGNLLHEEDDAFFGGESVLISYGTGETGGGDDQEYFTFPDPGLGSGDTVPVIGTVDDEEECDQGGGTDVNDDMDNSDGVGNDEEEEESEEKRKVIRKPVIETKSGQSLSDKLDLSEVPEKVEASPRKRKYVCAKYSTLPSDSITGMDPTKQECPLCHMHFKVEMLESHIQGHAKERHLKCPGCDKAYFTQAMLRKHMRVHQPEKYGKKCRLCGKLFYQSDKVLAHERFCVKRALEKNEPVDPEIIWDLKKRSSTATDWLDSLDNQDSNPSDSFTSSVSRKQKCPHCHKSFKSSFFQKHLKSHNIPRNWSCNFCDKSYIYKHDLVRHVATEHGQNQSCEFCDKPFDDRTSLRKHEKKCRKQHKKKSKKADSVAAEATATETGETPHPPNVKTEMSRELEDIEISEEVAASLGEEDLEGRSGTPTAVADFGETQLFVASDSGQHPTLIAVTSTNETIHLDSIVMEGIEDITIPTEVVAEEIIS